MSTVQEIESAIKKLSPAELSQIRDWLEDFLEDQKEFTPEFQARVEAADEEQAYQEFSYGSHERSTSSHG